jgi:histidine triad (HIT) family protein
MAANCIFCRIAAGELPTSFVYEDEDVVAFPDIHPQAPTHVLVMPRRHVESLAELDDPELAGRLLLAAREVARRSGVAERGFRTIINTGAEGGQTVPHLHLHVLAGTRFVEGSLGG